MNHDQLVNKLAEVFLNLTESYEQAQSRQEERDFVGLDEIEDITLKQGALNGFWGTVLHLGGMELITEVTKCAYGKIQEQEMGKV